MSDRATSLSNEAIDRARRETDIAALIGGHVALKRHGKEFRGLCPFHKESTPSFFVIPSKGMYHCFGCSANGDAIGWLMATERLSFRDAVERLNSGAVPRRVAAVPPIAALPATTDDDDVRKKIARARALWNEAMPATGTIVERYLESRGLRGVTIPATLRFHKALWHAEAKRTMPGMVAAVIARSTIVGIHRTYLRLDGRGKAEGIGKAKMMLGPCRGGHVWLDDMRRGVIAVAEGIETALTVRAACPGIDVWAALSLGNMDAPLPARYGTVILCADGDNKDDRAAEAVITRAARMHMRPGRTVRIARPTPGMDFNDMIRGAA